MSGFVPAGSSRAWKQGKWWLSRIGHTLARQPDFVLGLLLFVGMLYIVALPGTVAHQSPFAVHVSSALRAPSAAHLFGTDQTGRDLFARVIYGARVTLGLVAGSLLLAGVIGGALGLLAGFFGGAADMAPSRFVDVVLSFPPIVLGVVITGVLGPGAGNLVLALAVVYAPVFFRIARSGAIAENSRAYIEAARCLGTSEVMILVRHVARNVLPLLLVQYMILFPLTIQIEAALGFLGLGVQPPTPDWGSILAEAKNTLFSAPWMSIFPGIFILIAAATVTLVGRGIQQRFDRAASGR